MSEASSALLPELALALAETPPRRALAVWRQATRPSAMSVKEPTVFHRAKHSRFAAAPPAARPEVDTPHVGARRVHAERAVQLLARTISASCALLRSVWVRRARWSATVVAGTRPR